MYLSEDAADIAMWSISYFFGRYSLTIIDEADLKLALCIFVVTRIGEDNLSFIPS